MSPMPNPASGGISAASRMIQSGVTPEYMEAVHILNESTMSQACDLLLSERDYQEKGDGSMEVSDQEKLLELYNKCYDAWKVIEKQQATVSATLPGAPSLLAPPPAPRLGAPVTAAVGAIGGTTAGNRGVSTLPKLKQKTVVAGKQGIIPPMRARGSLTRGSSITGTIPPKPPGKRALEREKSDSSLRDDASHNSAGSGGSSSINNSGGHNVTSSKKARLSPPLLKDVKAPPPSALNFLAKLNQDPKDKKQQQQQLQQQQQQQTQATPESPSQPERRKNPPRPNRRSSA